MKTQTLLSIAFFPAALVFFTACGQGLHVNGKNLKAITTPIAPIRHQSPKPLAGTAAETITPGNVLQSSNIFGPAGTLDLTKVVLPYARPAGDADTSPAVIQFGDAGNPNKLTTGALYSKRSNMVFEVLVHLPKDQSALTAINTLNLSLIGVRIFDNADVAAKMPKVTDGSNQVLCLIPDQSSSVNVLCSGQANNGNNPNTKDLNAKFWNGASELNDLFSKYLALGAPKGSTALPPPPPPAPAVNTADNTTGATTGTTTGTGTATDPNSPPVAAMAVSNIVQTFPDKSQVRDNQGATVTLDLVQLFKIGTGPTDIRDWLYKNSVPSTAKPGYNVLRFVMAENTYVDNGSLYLEAQIDPVKLALEPTFPKPTAATNTDGASAGTEKKTQDNKGTVKKQQDQTVNVGSDVFAKGDNLLANATTSINAQSTTDGVTAEVERQKKLIDDAAAPLLKNAATDVEKTAIQAKADKAKLAIAVLGQARNQVLGAQDS